MKYQCSALVFVLCATLCQVQAQREFFGPPPTGVNAFFGSCFQKTSTSVGVNWRSIADFIITHTSWYDNSNAGACAPTNPGPDFSEEAACWKKAFSELISPSSPELQVSHFCVDRLVVLTSGRKKRSTGPFIEGESMDSRHCPAVDPATFASMVARILSQPGTLPPKDHTLDDFASIIEFVKKAGMCNEPICNRCDIRYKNILNPRRELACNQCWPTRLAGMIKNSSPLKIPVTAVATRLGGDTNIIGPPPPFVNQFFANCINSFLDDGTNWKSVTDFMIYHTSWYDNSNVGACAPSENVEAEARCWKRAFGKVIHPSSPLLKVVTACVDRFVAISHGLNPPRSPPNLGLNGRGRSLDNNKCPAVNPETFTRAFINRVQATTIPTDFFATDSTLNSTLSVIAFVRESGLCNLPTCDQCRTGYRAKNNPRRSLRCNQCWPTRLAGMIKRSSPLKYPAVFASIVAAIGL